jgi:hypothetical protein
MKPVYKTFQVHLLLNGHRERNFLTGLISSYLIQMAFRMAKDGLHSHITLLLALQNQSLCTEPLHTLSSSSSSSSSTNNHTTNTTLVNLFLCQNLPTLHILSKVDNLHRLHQITVI